MSILSCFFGFVYLGRFWQIAFSVLGKNVVSYLAYTIIWETQRVGTHVCDKTNLTFALYVYAFVELLCRLHGTGSGKAELSAGFLLEWACNKRRWGGSFFLAFLYGFHLENRALSGCEYAFCFLLWWELLLFAACTVKFSINFFL